MKIYKIEKMAEKADTEEEFKELFRIIDSRQYINTIVITTERRHPDWEFHFFGQVGQSYLWYKRGANPINGLALSNGEPGQYIFINDLI